MVIFYATTVLFLAVFIIFSKLNSRYQEEVFRMKMFKLRDELRLLAIERKVDVRSEEFDYIDFSISKKLNQSYFLTLLYVFSLEKKSEKLAQEFERHKERFDKLIKNIENNSELKKVFIKNESYLREYMLKQSPVLLYSVTGIIKLFFNINAFNRKLKKKLFEVNYNPNLSGI